jgi:response regulator RpfG family c-di-GMP phosphodiesterase
MQSLRTPTNHPTALKIFEVLREREYEEHSAPSQQHVDEWLARQVANLLDVALPWQQGHGRRTAALAQAIGSAAGLCRDALHHLTLAALLHDIGLLALPNAFPSHIGYLDMDSYAAVQCHPRLGAQWLESFPFLRHASVIIAHHHERWDGSGYPYGIRGPFIPFEARVLAIADAFDAIQVSGVTDQTTRSRTAYRILTVASGTQFDPQLVEICGHCLQRQTHVSLID